jgi:hypothetical protein
MVFQKNKGFYLLILFYHNLYGISCLLQIS